jgi:hypothetical protein
MNRIIINKNITEYRNESEALNREDGPALILKLTDVFREEWYQNGKRHRIDGPAYYYTPSHLNKYEEWFLNDQNHRVGGPAIIYPKNWVRWNRHGLKHRLNAPAIIFDNGNKKYYEFDILIKS